MTSRLPSFSIIIPTFRRETELVKCLNCLKPSVLSHSSFLSSLEVIVSDDAFDNHLRQSLQQLFPWLTYVQGPGRGPAANRNHGASFATSEWLVFTDDDCLPQPGWLEAFAKLASSSDVLEGCTLPLGTRHRIDEECPINEAGGFLWSCNFAIRSSLFRSLHGFNENFPAAAMEDVDLRTRLSIINTQISFVSQAIVLHPWRLRKGFAFVKLHSRSVAYYIRLHPFINHQFTPLQQWLKSLRSLKHAIAFSLAHGIIKGLFRHVALDFYSNMMVLYFLRSDLS